MTVPKQSAVFGMVCVVGSVAVLAEQIDVITYLFCTVGFTDQMGASGVPCCLEMNSLVLAAVTCKARCMSGYNILL